MSGLNLISTYASDSDDEEEEKKEKNNSTKNCNNLPLPESILSWEGVVYHKKVIDDPSKHGGRIRSFKHERGNWATLVYINYVPSNVMQAWINSISTQMSIENNITEEFHLSITKTLILKFHWIESFVDSLKKLCQQINRFILELTDLRVYSNEEKTCTFLGIHCSDNNGTLGELVHALNNLLTEYQLPPFYEDPSYHISFLWFLGDKETDLRCILPSLTSTFNKLLTENENENYIEVNKLNCKIGNRLYSFPLR